MPAQQPEEEEKEEAKGLPLEQPWWSLLASFLSRSSFSLLLQERQQGQEQEEEEEAQLEKERGPSERVPTRRRPGQARRRRQRRERSQPLLLLPRALRLPLSFLLYPHQAARPRPPARRSGPR